MEDLKGLSGMTKIRKGIEDIEDEDLRGQAEQIVWQYSYLTTPWSTEEDFRLGHEMYEALFLEVAVAPRMYSH